MIPTLIGAACLLAITITAVFYRICANPSRPMILAGGLIIAGLSGLQVAVTQTIVERIG